MNKRIVILVGAGASVEYGLPATDELSYRIDQEVRAQLERKINESNDPSIKGYYENALWCYNSIKNNLAYYYGDEKEAHFERLYHAISESLQLIPLDSSALPRFKPMIQALANRKNCYDKNHLWVCSKEIIRTIYKQVELACSSSQNDLSSLKNFLSGLSSRFISRIYTTNYDNFFEKATNFEWVSGFNNSQEISCFDPSACWDAWDKNCIFHLHGSIHFGFQVNGLGSSKFVSYKDLNAAYESVEDFSGPEGYKLSGNSFERSPIITGLDKLDKIQQSPFSHYFACLGRDIMEADTIFIMGSGLADLHINYWVSEARKNNRNTKIIFVDYLAHEIDFLQFIDASENLKSQILKNDFECDLRFDTPNYSGWTINSNRDLAIWSKGFGSFLKNWHHILDFVES